MRGVSREKKREDVGWQVSGTVGWQVRGCRLSGSCCCHDRMLVAVVMTDW